MNPLLPLVTLILVTVLPIGSFASETSITSSNESSLFLADEQIQISGSIAGDLYLASAEARLKQIPAGQKLIIASGQTEVETSRFGLALVATGDFSTQNARFQDLIQASGRVRLRENSVEDTWIAAAGTIETDAKSEVKGDSVLAAGDVLLDGNFHGKLYLAAGTVRLKGLFRGPLNIVAEKIEILPGARLERDLTYRAETLVVSPEATLIGETLKAGDFEGLEDVGKGLAVMGTIFGLALFFGTLLVGPVVALVFRKTTSDGAAKLLAKPMESFGYGFLALLVLPSAIGVGLFSIVGSVLALALLPFIACGLLIALGTSTVFVAEAIRFTVKRRSGKKTPFKHELLKSTPGHRFLWLLAGAVTLAMGSWVPVVGGIAATVLFAGSVGALVRR